MKKDKQSLTWRKNGFIFLLRLYRDQSFSEHLISLCKKWQSPYRDSGLGYAGVMTEKEIKEKKLIAYSQRAEFMNVLKQEGEDRGFYGDIDTFLKSTGLGNEWFEPVVDYIISTWLFPPSRNFDISVSQDNQHVVLTLNPNTSLEDIEAFRSDIKRKQNELWPGFREKYYTKKSLEDLYTMIEDSQTLSVFRKKEIDTVFKKSSRLTDIDLIERYWGSGAVKTNKIRMKKLAVLRTRRRRFKSK